MVIYKRMYEFRRERTGSRLVIIRRECTEFPQMAVNNIDDFYLTNITEAEDFEIKAEDYPYPYKICWWPPFLLIAAFVLSYVLMRLLL